MSSVVLAGSTSGSITVNAAAVAGSNTAILGAATGTHYPFTAGTAVASTSGTSIDFTSIPSWVKRITVMFQGISTSGTSVPIIQLGDAGGIENTGYLGTGVGFAGTVATTRFTTGFGIRDAWAAAYIAHGVICISKINGNAWCASGSIGTSEADRAGMTAGSKELSDTLTQVRITTVNGTDTFDAGSINILYE
jgi:hypothetical protein